MELRAGFKQTEVGAIPEDWDLIALGQMFGFKNGLNKAKEFFGYGTPIVNYMDVFQKPGLRTTDLSGRVHVNRNELKAYEVRKGDVFFTRTSETVEEIGVASAMLNEPNDTVFSGFVLRARPTDQSLDNEFKKYCFSARYLRQQVTSRASYTTRALTNGRSLSATLLARPPLPEQRAIAAALSDADALIASLDALIAKKRDLKQATIQQLLTCKTRLPGFNGEWEVKRLGELLEYEQPTKYLVSSTDYDDSYDVPVLTAGKTFVLGRTNETHSIFKDLPAIIFDDFTTASKLVTFPFKAKSSAMKILKPRSKDVNLRIVYELMQMVDFVMTDHKRYWISEFQKIGVEVPEPKEQTAIAEVLSLMDTELATLEAQRDKARALKQGMMQELLTGRIRLV